MSLAGFGRKAVAANLEVPTHHQGYGFGVGDVLFGEDALRQGMRVVRLEDRDAALQHNDAVIQMLIDVVHGAAGDFYAVVEGLCLCVEAGEGGQQRRMDVENAIGVGGDEAWESKRM